MDIDAGKEEMSELRANIEDAKNNIIPWRTLVSITKIYSSTLGRSNQLNSILLGEMKSYKEREENDLKKSIQSAPEMDTANAGITDDDEVSELRANIDDAKNDIIPWRTLVSITKIFSSNLERSNQLNSILLEELKGYKERETENDLKKGKEIIESKPANNEEPTLDLILEEDELEKSNEITPTIIAKEIVESKTVEVEPNKDPLDKQKSKEITPTPIATSEIVKPKSVVVEAPLEKPSKLDLNSTEENQLEKSKEIIPIANEIVESKPVEESANRVLEEPKTKEIDTTKEFVESETVEKALLEKEVNLDLEVTNMDDNEEPLEKMETDPMLLLELTMEEDDDEPALAKKENDDDPMEKLEKDRLEELKNISLEKLAQNAQEDEVIDVTLDKDNGSSDKNSNTQTDVEPDLDLEVTMEDEPLEKLEPGRRKFKATSPRTDVGKHPSDVNKTGANKTSMKMKSNNPGIELLHIFNRDVNKLLQDDEQIWNYFEPCDDSIHHAICIFCNKKLSLNKTKFGQGSGSNGMIYHTQSRHPQEFKKLSLAASFTTPKQKHHQSNFRQKSHSEQQSKIPYNDRQQMKTRSATKTLMTRNKNDPMPYRRMLPRSVSVTKINPTTIPFTKQIQMLQEDDVQIWDFFEPCLDSSTNRVICKVCNSELSSNKAIFGKGSGSYGMLYHMSQKHPQEFNRLPIAASFQTPKQKKNSMLQQAQKLSYSEPKIKHPISYSQQMKTRLAQMTTRSAANNMMTSPSSKKTVQFFNSEAKIHNENQIKTRSSGANMGNSKIRPIPSNKKSMKTRSAVGIFQCKFCEVVKDDEKNLKLHVLYHFRDQIDPLMGPKDSLQCPECPQKSRDRITLLRHYAFTHKVFFKFGTLDDLKGRLPYSEPVIID